ncbi:MAG: polysaccharide biosynthesis/export family protein, partial [Candidatus Binatia bacterium]
PEDVLDIAVWKNQDISRTVVVRPDGMISLPLLNDVQAGGLTPRQLRDTLRQKLTEYLSDPEVSVIVNAVHSFKVSVMGAVEKPGRFELGSRTTVLDALALAGGFKESASPDQVIVLRNYGTEVKRLPFDYRRIAFEGGETENFPLQPGDIIVVPEGTPGQ